MEPFIELLKNPGGKRVHWDTQLEALFTPALKTLLDDWRPRDCTPTILSASRQPYSRHSISFVILQQYCGCVSEKSLLCCPEGWKLVLFGSQHFTAAGKNYSTLEGEALAIAWSLKKARLFLLGCKNLSFVTDHKALTRFFGDKELKEKTLMFSFRIKYLKGDAICAADTLSHYPVLSCEPKESDEEDGELVYAAISATEEEVVCVVDLRQVEEEEATRDEEYRLLWE
ncbi:uncharacterized protein LOC143028098 [Oratosquilla oratoria]|uniref:uncharacterized protein LOC143028098 n=1 Tax=Oratosquilla oratoria TaxID=337810 RepID=UPI003F7575A2